MGNLHTSSVYGITEIDLDFQSRNTQQAQTNIRFLEDKEMQLYQVLGCHNFDEFITKLHNLFRPEDIEVLKNFQPSVLEQKLSVFASERGELYNQEVEFKVDYSKLKQIEGIKIRDFIPPNNENIKYSISGDNNILYFKLPYNHENVKDLLNTFFKDRRFIRSSDLMTFAEKQIDSLNSRAIEIYTKDVNDSFTVKWQPSPIPNFPWGCTKKQLEEAIKTNNTQILQEFDRAGQFIKHYITEELCAGASNELKLAIKWTWQKNFISLERNPALFFQGTTASNFISSVQGSMGEFQAAIIFTYLEQQHISKSHFAQILGDKLKHGEQLKTDVSIIEDLGLQVKNISTIKESGKTQLLRDLETTIHPNKLSQYLDNPEQFLDYIANYYFNTTFAHETESVYHNLITVLGEYLGELMNFSMGEAVSDTICFYLIAGKYLVPASHILRAADALDIKNSILITSSYRGLPDLAYEMPYHQSKQGKMSPLYVEYWTHPYGDNNGWRPTARNEQTYNYLISKLISIRSSFNLFDDIEKYAIF